MKFVMDSCHLFRYKDLYFYNMIIEPNIRPKQVKQMRNLQMRISRKRCINYQEATVRFFDSLLKPFICHCQSGHPCWGFRRKGCWDNFRESYSRRNQAGCRRGAKAQHREKGWLKNRTELKGSLCVFECDFFFDVFNSLPWSCII